MNATAAGREADKILAELPDRISDVILPGSTMRPADLVAHAAQQLAPYKRQCEIVVLSALPAGSTGKILKHRFAAVARNQPIQRA